MAATSEPNFGAMCNIFGFVKRVVMATMTSFVRFSPYGLSTGSETLLSGLTNGVLLCQAGSFALLYRVHLALGAKAAAVTERFENAALQVGSDQQLEMAAAAAPQESLAKCGGHGASGNSATTEDKLQNEFSDLASSALDVWPHIFEFGNEMKDIIDKLMRCLDALHSRAGDSDELTVVLDTARVAQADHEVNMESFKNCIEYAAAVAGLSALGESSAVGSDSGSLQSQHKSLCDFSRVHVLHAGGFYIKVTDAFDEADDIAGLGTFEGVMSKFCMVVGQGLYDKHCKAKLAGCFNQVFKYSLEVVAVHHDVLGQCEADKKFPYLIRKPLLKDMRMEKLILTGTSDDERVFDNLESSQGLAFLRESVDIIGAHVVEVPGTTHADEKQAASGMPVEFAVFVADLSCAAFEIGLVASHLQQDLMILVSEGGVLNDEAIYGQVAFELKLHMTKVAKLEDIIASPSCLACERSAWQLPVSLSTMREWAKCMSIVGGDMQALWLQQVSRALASRSNECASSVPSWSACFEDGRMLPSVAQKLLVGRLSAVVAAHNGVHQLMTQLASAAAVLQVSPRLQENNLTIDNVRVAFDIMAKANDASIVILATELVLKFEKDNSGIEGARAFLRKYKRSEHGSLPEGLCLELESIAAHASGSTEASASTQAHSLQGSPSSKAPSSTTSRSLTCTPTASRQRPDSDADTMTTAKESPSSGKRRAPATLSFSSSKPPKK